MLIQRNMTGEHAGKPGLLVKWDGNGKRAAKKVPDVAKAAMDAAKHAHLDDGNFACVILSDKAGSRVVAEFYDMMNRDYCVTKIEDEIERLIMAGA